MTDVNTINPFLKWAGGKRWLFDCEKFELPKFDGRYIEPFLGGGAVFFRTLPEIALLGDANNRLIELYQSIRDEPEEFENLLNCHAARHSEEYYYKIRSKSFSLRVQRATQFLYLNRTCFNGLYRENKKGEFNVPKGTKDSVLFPSDDFSAWSNALLDAELVCQDFEISIDKSAKGDFVFVDPPYTVMHNLNGFVKYNQNIFAWEDQLRLQKALVRASNRGVLFAMTNADHCSIRELYTGFGTHRSLSRNSLIAGNADHRSKSSELLVRNY